MAPRSKPDKTNTTAATKPQKKPFPHHQQQQQSVVGGVMGSLRVLELQLVAFIMVFSARGLVSVNDLFFPAFTSVFLLALSLLSFPAHGSVSSGSEEIFQGNKLLKLNVVVGATIGLFLPLAYVLGGFVRGDEHAIRAAVPHLFLLSCQIMTEHCLSGLSLLSPPVRALIPLLYTVRRVIVIIDWISDMWLNKTLPPAQKDILWFLFGRSLPVTILLYISIDLFGILIPLFLPRAFELYFRERDKNHAKTAQDKRSADINKSLPNR